MMIVALFCVSDMRAQEFFLVLEITKRGTVRKTKHYYEGHWVEVKTIEGQRLKGNFIVVDKKTIKINGQKIALNNIRKIRFDNNHFFSGIALTVIGPPLFFGGLLATAFEEGIGAKREDPNNNAEIATALGIGAFVTGLVILTNKDKHTESKRWNISIVEK
ncbi:MAG: hypothetical protein ACFB0A_11475 [Croceivirga sp.]